MLETIKETSSSIMVNALREEWKDIQKNNLHICQFPEDMFTFEEKDGVPQIVIRDSPAKSTP